MTTRRPVRQLGPSSLLGITRTGLVLLALATQAPAQLSVDFTATPTSGDAPVEVAFVATATGGSPLTWNWNFGDGTTGFGPTPVHTYTAEGTYSVSLLAAAAGFQVDQIQKPDLITVGTPHVVAAFSAGTTQGPVPLTVSFQDESTGTGEPDGWTWAFGDGFTTTEGPQPEHTYSTPGTYSVSLTASLLGEQDTVVWRDLVVVEPVPLVAGFSTSVTGGTNPLSVSFSDETTGTPPTAWTWDFGDGVVQSADEPAHVYDAPGTYSVSLTASYFGQSDTVVMQDLITVAPAVFAKGLEAAPLAGLPPLEVSFVPRVDGATPTAWSWDFGDGHTSTAQNPTHTYVSPGTHDVTLTVSIGGQQDPVVEPGLIRVGAMGGTWVEVADVSLAALADQSSVAVSPLHVLAGAAPPWYSPSAGGGAAQVLRREPGGAYVHEATLKPAIEDVSDMFGVAVAVTDRFALVGAPTADDFDGAAYLFRRDGPGLWSEVAKLSPPPPSAQPEHGSAVALTDDFAVVGAWRQTVGFDQAGAASVYERQADGSWPLVAQLQAPHPQDGGRFGNAVALDGARLLVGAPGQSADHPGQGVAYLYERDAAGDWVLVSRLEAQDAANFDGFGHSVALDGDLALVGAPQDDHFDVDAGSAYVFQLHEHGSWTQLQTLRDRDGYSGDHFGTSVAIAKERLVVGVPNESTVVNRDGVVVIYERLGAGRWDETARLYAGGVEVFRFGADVAAEGDTISVARRTLMSLSEHRAQVFAPLVQAATGPSQDAAARDAKDP
jgi:PKD repeat protein